MDSSTVCRRTNCKVDRGSANLNAFCKEHLNNTYKVEVIDLQKEPWHARTDQIVAIPTLVDACPFRSGESLAIFP
jgi:hypothetical protein